jgi:hypothetical protein
VDTAALSTLQNSMRAINGIGTAGKFIAGNTTSAAYATSVVLSTQAGWIANIQVLSAGSAPGFIYNAPTFAGVVDANKLMPIQTALGLQHGFVNFNNGMVVVPGPGQLVNVTYSLQQQQVTT